MKTCILFLLFFSLTSAMADVKDWSIVKEKGDFWLQYKDSKKLKALITKRTGESKVIKTVPAGKNHEVIVYYTGMAGTSKLVDIYYAIIFDKKNKKFLGDYPWKYEGHDQKAKLPQPVWVFKKEKIEIKDEQTDLDTKVDL